MHGITQHMHINGSFSGIRSHSFCRNDSPLRRDHDVLLCISRSAHWAEVDRHPHCMSWRNRVLFPLCCALYSFCMSLQQRMRCCTQHLSELNVAVLSCEWTLYTMNKAWSCQKECIL